MMSLDQSHPQDDVARPVIEAVGEKSAVVSSDDTGAAGEPIDAIADRRLLWKCDFHVIPVLFVLYMLSFLDRINIGNANIQGLSKELHLSGGQYNVALLIFFVPYVLLEVPSNLILKKVAPSTWLSLLLLLWGVATTCQGVVKSYGGLVACRFFLGAFESGVFPGCAFLISMYYKRHELQTRWTFFFSSGLVAGAFGGLLAFALAKMDGVGGYSGWRWIFIIEGLATVVYAVFAKFFIPDWPEDAKFLSAGEKALLARRLVDDKGTGAARMDRLDRPALKLILTDWKIWTGTCMYMGVVVSGYSSAFFIPTILTGFHYTASQSQLHTIPVYVVCTALTLLTAWASDRLRHRYSFIMSGIILATIGYIILLAQGPPKGPGALSYNVRYMAVFFVVSGIYVTQPMAIVWLTNNMGGHYKRSFGTAIQIGVGNIGGIIGSNIYLTREAPRFWTGYGTALAMLWFCALMATTLYVGMKAENKKRDRGERDGRLSLPKVQLDNLGDAHPEFRYSG